MKKWVAWITAACLCAAGPCVGMAAPCQVPITMQTQRPYYDATVTDVGLYAGNVASYDYGFDAGCTLEYQNGAIWSPVQESAEPNRQKIPAWGAALPANTHDNFIAQSLTPFELPLAPGTYRIGKTFTASKPDRPQEEAFSETRYAEFQVVEPSGLLPEDLYQLRLQTELGPGGTMRKGDVKVSQGEVYGVENALLELWHELAVFQKMKGSYANALAAPVLTVTLTGETTEKTVSIYRGDGYTYAKAPEGWYSIPDGDLAERLLEAVERYGGY